ncbi:hypothetical protein MRB53_032893 [Persea americana]|uniref:Uncharacterized protein n=1 Tax=Persea americana TaxID=3435 RepID=A0ACC2KTD8_PERAE|nr:hypothetical protein MRB53_032893 [Persea americana]
MCSPSLLNAGPAIEIKGGAGGSILAGRKEPRLPRFNSYQLLQSLKGKERGSWSLGKLVAAGWGCRWLAARGVQGSWQQLQGRKKEGQIGKGNGRWPAVVRGGGWGNQPLGSTCCLLARFAA